MLNCKRRRESEGEVPEGNQPRNFCYDGSRLLDLPSPIIIKILRRTRTKEVVLCRCVCKTLRSLISDPYFVRSFIARSPFISILLSSEYDFHFVKIGGSPNYSCGYKKPKQVNTSFIKPKSSTVEIIGCCNGVMCFWDKYSTDKLFITNPVLGEYAVLFNPWSDKYAALKHTYGFVFCPATEEYKVIKIKVRRAFREPNRQGYYRKTEVWILVVGSDKWRYVGDAPFPQYGRFCHVILNGRLHWMVDNDHKGPISLHSLDITKEIAHPVPAPPALQSENLSIEFGVLGTSLCLFDSSQNDRVEIWSMREYGVGTSWRKSRILTASIGAPVLSPLTVWSNGTIMMSSHRGPIVCYDSKKRKLRKIYRFHGSCRGEVVLYTPSFLPLKHVSKGACLRFNKVKSYP